jgi:hypothetical protein
MVSVDLLFQDYGGIPHGAHPLPGLTLFVDYPEVPMDNNYGERQLRNPVVGRKNYYGSGSSAFSRIPNQQRMIHHEMPLAILWQRFQRIRDGGHSTSH